MIYSLMSSRFINSIFATASKLTKAANNGGLQLESSVSPAKGLQTDYNSGTSGTEVSDTEPESE